MRGKDERYIVVRGQKGIVLEKDTFPLLKRVLLNEKRWLQHVL